jgi:hypothetical protein
MRLCAPALASLFVLFSCGQQSSLGRGFVSGTPSATCASGQTWTGGNSESDLMNPGFACRACHLGQNFQGQNPSGRGEGSKAYFFMGTVYSAPHEADLCAADAVPSDAVVEILDADGGVQVTMTVNSAGNFRSRSTAAGLPMPYKARVRAGGKTSAMGASQTEGDCNTCHTAAGTGGAPGRVLFPQ